MDEKILEVLGRIEARQQEICRSQDKMFYGLLAVIAAQIGVKMLSTDPLLYVATTLAAVGLVLTLGAIFNGLGHCLNSGRSLTLTGWLLTVFLVMVAVVQIAVFLRDVGGDWITVVSPRIVYFLRCVMNSALLVFVWRLWGSPRLFK